MHLSIGATSNVKSKSIWTCSWDLANFQHWSCPPPRNKIRQRVLRHVRETWRFYVAILMAHKCLRENRHPFFGWVSHGNDFPQS